LREREKKIDRKREIYFIMQANTEYITQIINTSVGQSGGQWSVGGHFYQP